MKQSSVSVSWHTGAKQYVRYVGYANGRDGQPKPKSFYLGEDEPTALATAAQLRADWSALRASGATAWPVAYLDDFQRARNAGNATVGRLLNGQTVGTVMSSETVADVRCAYLDEQRARLEGKQLSQWGFDSLAHRLTVVLDRLPSDILGRSIRSVGEDDLRKVILHWSALPNGMGKNQTKRATTGQWVAYRWRKNAPKRTKKTVGKPISPRYAQQLIATLKVLFIWAHETERWDKPRRFERLFKLKFPRQQVEAERFTTDELSLLYKACPSDRHRLWILLGLNAGLDRTGLATLDWGMVKGLDSDRPMIERLRHKTGVYSRHVLWSETAELLRDAKPSERKGLVCQTERGEPLVDGQRDSVHAAWRYLTVNAGVRHLSYGKLRKTGAWLVKVAGGLEVSEMYLAHVEAGMNKHYAGSDWAKLDAALTVIRSQVGGMFAERAG